MKNWLIGKDPAGGRDWRQEEKRVQMMWWLDRIADKADMSLSKLQEIVMERVASCAAVDGVSEIQTGLSDWTTNYILWWQVIVDGDSDGGYVCVCVCMFVSYL